MFTILDQLRRRISTGLYSLSERVSNSSNQRSNIKASVSVIPRSKFAIACASLGKLVGLTRSDTFYRCEYDLGEIKAASETDSYLRMAIKKYTELFIKSGYVFKGRNDDAVKYLEQRFRIMSYMTDQSFDQLMKETAYDLVKFSNAFWVKSRVDKIPFLKVTGITGNDKVVGGYFRVDPDSIQVKFDKNGQVVGYKQVTQSGNEKKFSTEDVIHFTFDRDPGSVWGVPRWIAALEDIRILRKIEGDSLSLLYRYSIPMMHAKVGLEQAGMQGTEKEVDDTRAVIEHTPPDGVLITTERVNLDMIGADGNAIDMTPYLSYFENRVFTALNTSQAMMGRGGTKQDADSMEEQIHNAVKDNQAMFVTQFGHAVITELLLEGGFNPILNDDDIVDLKFNEINLDTRVKLENHEVNLFQSNAITFEEGPGPPHRRRGRVPPLREHAGTGEPARADRPQSRECHGACEAVERPRHRTDEGRRPRRSQDDGQLIFQQQEQQLVEILFFKEELLHQEEHGERKDDEHEPPQRHGEVYRFSVEPARHVQRQGEGIRSGRGCALAGASRARRQHP